VKIAIFDYVVTATNPVGSCHLHMLEALCGTNDFTVFAVRFDNPCPARIRWVRIPAPARPLVLLFIVYHLLCPLYYWAHRLRRGVRFDVVQTVESNALVGSVSYAHFCHAWYLRRHWKDSGARGWRGWFRFLDHKAHALMEPIVYRRAQSIIVPSHGLARELEAEYPWLSGKISVVANPVNLHHWQKPDTFEAAPVRRQLGIPDDSFVLVFVALGHFERKGLPLLLDALAESGEADVKLLVVGGQPASVKDYALRCKQQGLEERVLFTGMQRDVRPYLWAGDAFVLPSQYEVFPLVCLQAAAAGLPLVVSQLNGVEEFLVDRENGLLVGRTAPQLQQAVRFLRALDPTGRAALTNGARRDVQRYSVSNFASAWDTFYRAFRDQRGGDATPAPHHAFTEPN
jgi:glycosyltransferase involved in cell wall biosynthesis